MSLVGKISTLFCIHSTGADYDLMAVRALESLVAQSRKPEEIVIVFDECPYRTINKLGGFAKENEAEIEWGFIIRKEKEGLAAAKNAGLKMCTGDWITYLDADDQWMPCKLEVQEKHIYEVNMPIDLCFTQAWDSYGGLLKPNCFAVGQYQTHEQIATRLLFENVLCHGSAMIRREVFDKLGGYHDVRGQEDWNLWKRAVEAGFKFYNVPERLYIYSMGTGVER